MAAYKVKDKQKYLKARVLGLRKAISEISDHEKENVEKHSEGDLVNTMLHKSVCRFYET